jgi:glycosyltransferase involved in cell wall biosynthesis
MTVAPLTECSRNVEQGCCPLKILESMMAGTPVVASDLPAVRELVEDRRHGVLVPPDRPAELARAIRVLAGDPERRTELGRAARERALERFTWDASNRALAALYAGLGVGA